MGEHSKSHGRSIEVPWETHVGLLGVPWARIINSLRVLWEIHRTVHCNMMGSMETHGSPMEDPIYGRHTMSQNYDRMEIPWESL